MKKGKLFSFELLDNMGFGYALYYDFENDGVPKTESSNIFVLNIKTKKLVRNIFEKDEFDTRLLFGSYILVDEPPSRGRNAWKYLCDFEMDFFRPDYKQEFSLKKNSSESSKSKWFLHSRPGQQKGDIYPYYLIRHLEKSIIHTTKCIEARATLEFLRKDKHSLLKFVKKNINSYIVQREYNLLRFVPDYDIIPPKYKGIAFPLNYMEIENNEVIEFVDKVNKKEHFFEEIKDY